MSLLALLLASLPTPAQGPHLRPAPAPRATVRVDAATGAVTRAPAQARVAGEVSEFPNLDLAGFVTVDTGASAVTWINDGQKGVSGNASDLVSRIVVPYCSAELDPALGGPGATVKLGFYEGFTRNSPTPDGVQVAELTFTGLPAHTAESSFFGNSSCYFLEVELDPALQLADGPIGYSWEFVDLGSDGVLAGTFPFLANTSSCSSLVPDPLGQAPYECCSFRPADAYDASGNRIDVFTTFPYCLPWSIAIDLREVADRSASLTAWQGDGVNVDDLSATAPIVGADWTARVLVQHPHGTGGLVRLLVRTGAVNGPTLVSPLGGRPFEVLASGTLLASFLLTHDGSTSALLSVPLPPSPRLVGTSFTAQAAVLGGGFGDLSSAVIGTVGTR